jgi:predicted dehydrogenase
MRIAVVGLHYGHISGMLASARNAPDAEWVGVVEADDTLYQRHMGEAAIPRYESVGELLAQARPELIIEGLRHDEKVDLVEQCGAAGVHLLLDKPLCRSLEEWERMRAAVAASDAQLSMWFTSRSYPPFIALRDLVHEGELGEIVSLISTHPHKLRRETATPWYFDDSAYAGTFHDLACHGVDQIRWLTGSEFTGVHAQWTCKRFTDDPPLIDHAQASFRLANGSLALLTADWLTPQASPSFGDTRFIIMGTRGSAHLRAYADDHLYVVSEAKGAYTPTLPEDRGAQFVEGFIHALTHNERPFIDTRAVLSVALACLRAQQSAQSDGAWTAIESVAID